MVHHGHLRRIRRSRQILFVVDFEAFAQNQHVQFGGAHLSVSPKPGTQLGVILLRDEGWSNAGIDQQIGSRMIVRIPCVCQAYINLGPNSPIVATLSETAWESPLSAAILAGLSPLTWCQRASAFNEQFGPFIDIYQTVRGMDETPITRAASRSGLLDNYWEVFSIGEHGP